LTPGQWAFKEQKESRIKQLKFNEMWDLEQYENAGKMLKKVKEDQKKVKEVMDSVDFISDINDMIDKLKVLRDNQ